MGFPPKHSIYNIYSYHIYIYIYLYLSRFQILSLSHLTTLFLDSQRKSLRSTGRGLASLDPQYFSYHVYKYLATTIFLCSPLRTVRYHRFFLCSHLRARYATTLFLCSPLRARYATTLFLLRHATLPSFSSLKNP